MSWLSLPYRTDRRGTLAQLGVCALSALLWVLATEPYALWPLAWIAMLPTLWLWGGAKSARRAGWLGGATGLLTTAGGFYWFAGLMHQHAGLPWPVAVLTLLALGAWQGLALLLAGRAVWWIRRWKPLPMALVAPVCVLAFEYAWPTIFPYQLAITQAPALHVIQIADLFGASAITMLLIGFAGAIFDLFDKGKRARKPAAIIAGLTAATFGYGTWRLADIDDARAHAPHAKVGLVQPNEAMHLDVAPDQMEQLTRLGHLQDETRALQDQGAEVVVWSEVSYPAALPHELARDLQPGAAWRIRGDFTVPVVIGATSIDGHHHYNSAFLFSGEHVVARDDKIHRVLGSEWDPITEWFPSLEGTLPAGYSGGDHPVVLPTGELRLGVAICLEDTLPGYVREVAANHPNLLVNMTIDTWFGSFAEPYQHRALAILRAVEERSDLVRAVNTGPSGLVEASGRLGAQTAVRAGEDVPVDGIVVDAALLEAGHTLYGTVGDLLPRLCVLCTVIGWVLGRRAHRAKKQKR